MRIWAVLMLPLVFAINAPSLPGQVLLHDYRGTAAFERFGRAIVEIGDLNFDGAPELAVSTGNGRVDVLDGSDGSLKTSLVGLPNEDFGATLAEIGDVNGDGVSDLAVGAPAYSDPLATGRVLVFSGANASILYAISGIAPGDHFGTSVLAVDLNQDGRRDLVVGAPGRDVPVSDAGRVSSFDGTNGMPISSANGTQAAESFGEALAKVSDVDGDGCRDIAVGGPGGNQPPMSNFFGGTGEVRVISGTTFLPLATIQGFAPGDLFGSALASTADLDGDGLRELLIGSPGRDEGPGIDAGLVGIYSSASGALIQAFVGVEAGERYGSLVVDLGDIDANGGSDFAVGSPTWGIYSSGRVELIDCRTLCPIASFHGTTPVEGVGTSVAASRGFGADKPGEFYFGAVGTSYNGLFSGQVKSFSFGQGLYGTLPRGNVGATVGGPFPILHINSQSGWRHRHQVSVELGVPFVVSMVKPPTFATAAPFVIYGMKGVASATDGYAVPGGVGTLMVTPCDVAPTNPDLFLLADTGMNLSCSPMVVATPTPWATLLPGLTSPATWTLQALIEVAPGIVEISNALVVTFN